MTLRFTAPAVRLRVLVTRFFNRLGFGDESFMLILAVIVGVVTAVAAVGFHQLILLIRDELYTHVTPDVLYGRAMILLILIPALGGLAVGLFSTYLLRGAKGHGIVDVMESVIRTSGFQRPIVAIEKILTSSFTIGSGGSAGAEGPIVQIGAAIASGVGEIFGLARQHMPLLTGCGCAAGISAIFNAPFGGVLFTLEVILQDFSIRAFTPIVVASVIAQVSTLGLYQQLARLQHTHEEYRAIFAMPPHDVAMHPMLNWGQVGNFVLLGLVCGLAGVALIKFMYASDQFFTRRRIPRPLVPAIGGAMLGVIGVLYVLVFGRLLLHQIKPFDFNSYPQPAFYGDGYGVVQQLLAGSFPGYVTFSGRLLILLGALCLIKIVATCLTLASGGSGGIIAPSLFIGATGGGVIGILLRQTGYFPALQPQLYALVGMGAVLAAVVHAPLASILIVFELTQDYKVMLPAMLACVIATGTARILFPDSIYTLGLRRRGVPIRGSGDLNLLSRLTVEQTPLEPAVFARGGDPFQKLVDLSVETGAVDFIVVATDGTYQGMIGPSDMHAALLARDAIPLLNCGDLARSDLPLLKNTDTLAAALEAFTQHDVNRLPVTVVTAPDYVVGMLSRSALMRRYQQEMHLKR
jgi:chloride channel protein, CIC family